MHLFNLKWKLIKSSAAQPNILKLPLSFFCFLLIIACSSPQDTAQQNISSSSQTDEFFDSSTGSIQPLPQNIKFDPARVALGKALFHDNRLSQDNSISCASCHSLKKGGTDNLSFSVGINGTVGNINAPTVLNSGFNFVQFWDGRSKTLEEQAAVPVHNPIEMGSNWTEVIIKLSSDKWLVEQFNMLYDGGMTGTNIQDAIATYERALITPNSPFDKYILGEKTAMSDEAIEGYHLFKEYGCVSCHQGINIGGNMFARLGVMDDYFKHKESITKEDYGRFNVTGRDSDKFKFKVPSLRNVALTAPYFHDGTAQTLYEAVRVMTHYQLGKPVNEKHVQFLVVFLESLTGEVEVSLK